MSLLLASSAAKQPSAMLLSFTLPLPVFLHVLSAAIFERLVVRCELLTAPFRAVLLMFGHRIKPLLAFTTGAEVRYGSSPEEFKRVIDNPRLDVVFVVGLK